MLILSRKVDEKIKIGNDITITIIELHGDQVKIGVEAPKDVKVFRQEVYSTEWPNLQKVLGDDEKRFDFVIQTPNKIYLIEVNFYSGGGSKLNEVARSYSDIAPKINSVPGFEFVWITDGIGWKSAKNKLQEAYSIIPSIYNLTSIKEFLQEVKG